jgi:alkylated DNA repair dioxygenase AlkB
MYRYDRSLLQRDSEALLLSADRDFIGELPEWLKRLSRHLKQWNPLCDQVLINEYLQGQRISAHIDHTSNFGATIISLSLCSTWNPDISIVRASGSSDGQSPR